MKQLFLKSEDAGNESARVKYVFLTLIEVSMVKLKQLQQYNSEIQPLPSGLVKRSVVRPGAAQFILVFKMGPALQPVLVLCLFRVQKRNLADLNLGL